jgi:hypothetical protein
MQGKLSTSAALRCALAAITLAGCGQGADDERFVDDALLMSPELRARAGRDYAASKTILFVNFDGGTISKIPLKSDAAANQSFIGGGTIPPFSGDAAARASVIGYLKALYAAYDITIVTTRPSGGDYDMAMVGGWPASLGLAAGPAGIAPLDCGNALRRDISFTFAEVIRSSLGSSSSSALFHQHVAKTIAHETGHSYGLPHSGDGCDLMSYAPCAQPKTFLDQEMSLQSDAQGAKGCYLTTMNSHQLLLQVLGPAPAPPPPPADEKPPVVTITSPASQATVLAPFSLSATVVDDHSVASAELREGTTVLGARTSAPFEFLVALSPGPHTLTVIGVDAAGNTGSASRSFTVASPPPVSPPTTSDAGAPAPDLTPPAPAPDLTPPAPAPGTFAAPCSGPDECASGLCARRAGGGFCTLSCEGNALCPSGSSCLSASGGVHVCGLPASEPGTVGGCSLSESAGGAPPPLVLLAFLGLAVSVARGRARGVRARSG